MPRRGLTDMPRKIYKLCVSYDEAGARLRQKVAEGVLAAESIWGENLNNIPGLTAAVKADLDSIQEKGMLETVKGIL